MQKRLRLEDINPEPYENLGAKLSYLCREQYGDDVKVKIMVAFSDQDTGRGNAILWLTKHFGVFPVEMGNPDGELDRHDLAELAPLSELTLIIQSVPLVAGGLEEGIGDPPWPIDDGVKMAEIDNLKTHVPGLNGSTNSFSLASADRLVQQIGVLSQLLANKEVTGPVVYLAGFNLVAESAQSGSLPYSSLIPWYLFLGDKNGVRRIYRQPELSKMLRQLPEDNPRIVDLESIISDMEMDQKFDCE